MKKRSRLFLWLFGIALPCGCVIAGTFFPGYPGAPKEYLEKCRDHGGDIE